MTASETRHSLLDEMPAPGDRSIRTVQFVGRDRTGAFALGLVRAMGDDALAYVSDGRSSGTWLSGSLSDAKLALSGRGKDRIEGRLSPGVVKGEGEVAGRHIEFQLETADQAAGVYRRLDRARSGTLESAWIVGNDGAVVGLTTSGDRVVLGYRLEGDDTG